MFFRKHRRRQIPEISRPQSNLSPASAPKLHTLFSGRVVKEPMVNNSNATTETYTVTDKNGKLFVMQIINDCFFFHSVQTSSSRAFEEDPELRRQRDMLEVNRLRKQFEEEAAVETGSYKTAVQACQFDKAKRNPPSSSELESMTREKRRQGSENTILINDSKTTFEHESDPFSVKETKLPDEPASLPRVRAKKSESF